MFSRYLASTCVCCVACCAEGVFGGVIGKELRVCLHIYLNSIHAFIDFMLHSGMCVSCTLVHLYWAFKAGEKFSIELH